MLATSLDQEKRLWLQLSLPGAPPRSRAGPQRGSSLSYQTVFTSKRDNAPGNRLPLRLPAILSPWLKPQPRRPRSYAAPPAPGAAFPKVRNPKAASMPSASPASWAPAAVAAKATL